MHKQINNYIFLKHSVATLKKLLFLIEMKKKIYYSKTNQQPLNGVFIKIIACYYFKFIQDNS